jgi:hypothetical protein
MVAGEAEEACIDAVQALQATTSIHVWTSDSDIICRLVFSGQLDIEIMRFSGFHFIRQTPRQILQGIGQNALKWAFDSAWPECNHLKLGFNLFVAWMAVSQHDSKPGLSGVSNYKTFLTALARELVETPISIDQVLSFII